MIEVEHGIWRITDGKGNRHYIYCNDKEVAMHPEKLCDFNGLGMYGYEHLQDLAIAILKFEKKKNEKEGILNKAREGE